MATRGRGDRTRTCGLLVPNQARYQLRNTSRSLFIITGKQRVVKIQGPGAAQKHTWQNAQAAAGKFGEDPNLPNL